MNNKKGENWEFSHCNFLNKNRRGLSAIIITLIIVGLSLVAVGIVWGVVSNLLQSSEEQTTSQYDTLFLDMKVEKVAMEDDGISVSISRGSGGGTISGVAITISDGENTKVIKREVSDFEQLEQKTFSITSSEMGEVIFVKSVSVSPLLQNSVGNVLDSLDNSVAYDTIFTGNLIEDPLFKDNSYWTSSWVLDYVNLKEAKVDTISCSKIATTSNIQSYSGYVSVDPYKTYRFSLWIKQNNPDSSLYFGFDSYNSVKTEISAKESSSSPVIGSSTNYYFWSGDILPSNTWRKITGYIFPCNKLTWTNPSDTTYANYYMDCSTAYLRIRFLNFDAPTYGTSIGTTAWYALPRIEEVNL